MLRKVFAREIFWHQIPWLWIFIFKSKDTNVFPSTFQLLHFACFGFTLQFKKPAYLLINQTRISIRWNILFLKFANFGNYENEQKSTGMRVILNDLSFFLAKSCGILQNLAECYRILKNLVEYWRILKNLEESGRILKNLAES